MYFGSGMDHVGDPWSGMDHGGSGMGHAGSGMDHGGDHRVSPQANILLTIIFRLY